ncbi:MAG: hypothetical protein LUF87_05420 [Alistipes sp.]|nr:hypothetical protein [Alistipes sp.]
MIRLFARLYGNRNAAGGAAENPGDSGSVFVATPHKLITIERVTCYREEEDTVLEFSLRNKGSELQCFGLKLINNFDCDGNEYDYRMTFGRNTGEDHRMVHYTLPHDIPIRVRVVFSAIPQTVTHLAQVKFSGLCLHKRHKKQKYNPSGILLLRNIPITDPPVAI